MNIFRNSFSSQTKSYQVNFTIEFKTTFGKVLAVVGDIEELGQWKKCKHILKCHDGHVWTSPKPLATDKSKFMYKYVVCANNKILNWEDGCNRIADLDTMPKTDTYNFHDVWESYKVKFTLYDALYLPGDTMYLQVDGMEAIKMERNNRYFQCSLWLQNKDSN